MANPNMQIDRDGGGVTSKVTNALKSDREFESGSLALSAHIAVLRQRRS